MSPRLLSGLKVALALLVIATAVVAVVRRTTTASSAAAAHRPLTMPSLPPMGSAQPASGPVAPATRPGFRTLRWPELVPAGWDTQLALRTPQQDSRALSDNDPQARERLAALRLQWATAPTNAALNGVQARIPGYVVPLESSAAGTSEFLLVPYFGACIHTPPPPANQVIHVRMTGTPAPLRAMDAVWVQGTLSTDRSDTALGSSGYRMTALMVEPYQPPAR